MNFPQNVDLAKIVFQHMYWNAHLQNESYAKFKLNLNSFVHLYDQITRWENITLAFYKDY